jgi:ATP-dependent helicase/nuclease subunit A
MNNPASASADAMTTAPGEPAELRLTEEQTRPLSVTGASVALESGAGCGKTTVLTGRYLRAVEEGPPLRSIIALTFTNKAARELRKRIREQCRRRLVREGEDPRRWRSVLRGLEAAPIGTFHEFAAQWLRDHAVLAGIDPDFTIVDEAAAASIRDEALARALRGWLAECQPDLIDLAVEFGLTPVRQALSDLVTRRALGGLETWSGRSASELVAAWKSQWQRQGRPARLHKLRLSARDCLALLSANPCSHAAMSARRAFLLEQLPRLENQDIADTWLGELREQAKVQGGGKPEHWPAPEVYERVKDSFKDLRDEIDDFLEKSRWDEAATLEAAEHGLRLARLAAELAKTYAALKRARGSLDFDDLMLLMRALLRERPELAAAGGDHAASRFLVDEFQDTDEVQGAILETLAGRSYGAGGLFLVGDAKQSIYRFRGAEPRIFAQFRERFPAAGHLALTENFRSIPAILDFVNALFADALAGGEHPLRPGKPVYPATSQPAVEFVWADETPADEEEGRRPQAAERRKTEARWIARRLRQRLDAGWTVRAKEGGVRKANEGDIALLFRDMPGVGAYEAALAAEGFDYHVVGGSAFYAQQEIHDLINVLSVLEDPLDAVALAGTLRSPFFCMSDDGLYWLAMSPHGALADGLEHADAIAELSPLDRSCAGRARALLQRWRSLKDSIPIAALVDRLLDESGYAAALLGESLGARKRANARKLVRLAREFDLQGGFTIAGFVASLRASLREPPREEQAATTDEEGTSVRLMSIHQAKGLEFPIVVLPDLNRRPQGGKGFVALSPQLGPLVRLKKEPEPGDDAEGGEVGQSLGWLTYRAIEQREDDDEALRLFYVAATRAQDALILSAGLGPGEKPASPAVSLLFERFDRQTVACRAVLPTGWNRPEVHVTLACPPVSSGPAVARPSRPQLLEVAETIEQAVVSAEPAAPPPSPPRFVDLEAARALGPTLGRLDRLIRATLADPRALETEGLARVVADLARRQQPAAGPRLVAEAIARLDGLVAGPWGQTLAGAAEIERALGWTIAGPGEAPDRTIYEGRTEFLFRRHGAQWTIVAVALAEAPIAGERLRLGLGARAAAALGFGPIGHGALLRLGQGGVVSEEPLEAGDLTESRFDARS